MKKTSLRATAVAVAALAATSAFATDGYFPHGYGMKALGMGGASVAMTDNAFAGANNPATASFSDSRADLGANVFSPKRSATQGPQTTESDKNAFLVPEFGYVAASRDAFTYGVTVYGNGGMNTDYPGQLFGGAGSSGTGVNLEQLIVAPVIAYKVSSESSIGVSPLLVRQTFSAKGLEGWGLSSSIGTDVSTGLGVRLGLYSKLAPNIAFGASYSPKTNMSKFDKYAFLFAEHGDFDIPANYTVGIAIDASPSVKLALDYQRIEYSGVKAIASASLPNFGNGLGSDNGPGFGWANTDIYKVGVEWKYSDSLTLRAGYNHTNNPVSSADVMFNILAPGVIVDHYTFGATYKVAKNSELTWAYMYAPQNSVSGLDMYGNPNTIRMSQQSLGVQYSWKF